MNTHGLSDEQLDCADRAHERRQERINERLERQSGYDVCNDIQYWYDLRDYGPEEARRRRSLRWQIRRQDDEN